MNKQFDRSAHASGPPRAHGAGRDTAGPREHCVDLHFRDEARTPDARFSITTGGFSAEHVVMHGAREYAYDVAGTANYLALHDLKMVDGEITLADGLAQRRLDLRDRLTLTPADCRATGFASLADRPNSFTAMTFDPDVLAKEVDRSGWHEITEPMLYFRDLRLQSTMTKLGEILQADDRSRVAHAETLGLLALFEINRLGSRSHVAVPKSGSLSARQQKQVRDYINDNLHAPLPLGDLADVTSLTRFHFARAFQRTFGKAPHQFIMQTRIDRAKSLLSGTVLPIAVIADRVGFKTPNHLSAVFRSAVGCTPSQFRRAAGGS